MPGIYDMPCCLSMENVAGGDKHSQDSVCRDVCDKTLSHRGQTEAEPL